MEKLKWMLKSLCFVHPQIERKFEKTSAVLYQNKKLQLRENISEDGRQRLRRRWTEMEKAEDSNLRLNWNGLTSERDFKWT